MLKKIIGVLSIVCMAYVVCADVDDFLMSYQTPGPDKYADGQSVVDGEYYAVVYAPNNAPFGGFFTDGTLKDNEGNQLIVRTASAKDGKCETTHLQIFKSLLPDGARTSGTFYVVLMDTRDFATGEPGSLVRGFGVIGEGENNNVQIASIAGSTTSTPSSMVMDIPQPVIESATFKDGVATISVSGTVPGAYYTVVSGDSKTGFRTAVLDQYAKRGGAGCITISLPIKDNDGNLFKIIVPSTLQK